MDMTTNPRENPRIMIISSKRGINKENEAINRAMRVDKVNIIIKINKKFSEIKDIMSRGDKGGKIKDMLKSRTTISNITNSLTTIITSPKNITIGKIEIQKSNKTKFKTEINQSMQIKNTIRW